MEFRPSKRMKSVVEPTSEYPHVLQLYIKPPAGNISLEEFETIAFDRLKMLRILEQAAQMGHKIYSNEWKTAVIGYLKKDGLRKYANLIQSTGSSETDADLSMRREDHISHFILRLCYCKSNDLRVWLVQREMELFKLRYSNLTPAGLKNFIQATGLSYAPISHEEKNDHKQGLMQSTAGYFHADIESKDFYKVPFGEVADLVSKRMVYLSNGYAYIPSTELVSCLISLYRSEMNEDLMKASRKLVYLDDDRVMTLIHAVTNSYTGKDYTTPDKREQLEVEDLEPLSKQSFPLCMRNLFEVIQTTHHLKHFGRLQFGLFLKGIGLSLDEAIRYWKTEFTKLIDEDKFNKSYLYNIKHSYGCIGKMTNYTPYSCMKIISTTVGPGECNGCPFKHWEQENLRKKIIEYGVNGNDAKDVLETVRNGHFQVACSKYFNYTHGGIESKALISHPNQYFEESREITTSSKDNLPKRPNRSQRVKTIKCEYCEQSPCICQTQSTSQEFSTQKDEFDDDFDPASVNWEQEHESESTQNGKDSEVSQISNGNETKETGSQDIVE